ncbi:hypothetical protein PR048_029687 [Dryococelus australis]|uniref:Uncharacterized protein n=1 Tax=Dryococelus australis TaxID=614101 RepID=A0ABQ9GE28_9NEOP|nr:hypothetical protein PR048_029687 [Dryococelus australis]
MKSKGHASRRPDKSQPRQPDKKSTIILVGQISSGYCDHSIQYEIPSSSDVVSCSSGYFTPAVANFRPVYNLVDATITRYNKSRMRVSYTLWLKPMLNAAMTLNVKRNAVEVGQLSSQNSRRHQQVRTNVTDDWQQIAPLSPPLHNLAGWLFNPNENPQRNITVLALQRSHPESITSGYQLPLKAHVTPSHFPVRLLPISLINYRRIIVMSSRHRKQLHIWPKKSIKHLKSGVGKLNGLSLATEISADQVHWYSVFYVLYADNEHHPNSQMNAFAMKADNGATLEGIKGNEKGLVVREGVAAGDDTTAAREPRIFRRAVEKALGTRSLKRGSVRAIRPSPGPLATRVFSDMLGTCCLKTSGVSFLGLRVLCPPRPGPHAAASAATAKHAAANATGLIAAPSRRPSARPAAGRLPPSLAHIPSPTPLHTPPAPRAHWSGGGASAEPAPSVATITFGQLLASRSWEPMRVIDVSMEQRSNEMAGETGEIPEKTRRPATSSATIPTCDNPAATPSGIEPVRLGGRRDVYPLHHYPPPLFFLDQFTIETVRDKTYSVFKRLVRIEYFDSQSEFENCKFRGGILLDSQCHDENVPTVRDTIPQPPKSVLLETRTILEYLDHVRIPRQLLGNELFCDLNSNTQAVAEIPINQRGGYCFPHSSLVSTTVAVLCLQRKDSRDLSCATSQHRQYSSLEQSDTSIITEFAAAVAERLARSPPTGANWVQSPAGSPDLSENRAGRCRWSAAFLGDLPFSPPHHFGAAPLLTAVTLIGSQDLVVKSRPNLFTLLQNWCWQTKSDWCSTISMYLAGEANLLRASWRGFSSPSSVVRACHLSSLSVCDSANIFHLRGRGGVVPPPPEQTRDRDSHESAHVTRRRRARTQLTSLSAGLLWHPTISGLVTPGFSHVGLVPGDAADGLFRPCIPALLLPHRLSRPLPPTYLESEICRSVFEIFLLLRNYNTGIVRHDSHRRVIRSGIEPGSPWWEASRLTAQPPRLLARQLRCLLLMALALLMHVAVSPLSLALFSSSNAKERKASRLLESLHSLTLSHLRSSCCLHAYHVTWRSPSPRDTLHHRQLWFCLDVVALGATWEAMPRGCYSPRLHIFSSSRHSVAVEGGGVYHRDGPS